MWETIKSFYNSKEWITFRLNVIAERSNKTNGIIYCEYCNKVISAIGDVEVDHVKELRLENINDYEISLNPKNVKISCHNCHNRKHRRFGNQKEKEVYIIYGAPLSGKKTYVKENMTRGDIVIDMDSLFSAISFFNLYDTVEPLKHNVFAVKNLLLDNVRTRYGKFNSAWVIGGYPNKHDRERLACDLNAKLVLMNTSKEVCLKRLCNCNDYRRYQKNEWEKYIEKWFNEFQL